MIPAHLDFKNPKYAQLKGKSDIDIVRRKALNYGIPEVYLSTNKNKKFMIVHPTTGRLVHFGSPDYEDFTYHKNQIRRANYRRRAEAIKGNWKNDRYSPNSLSLAILWN